MADHSWVRGPSYVGPAQVRLYVGEIWLDDACALQYQVRDDKTPKFGYNDERYRSVALGHTLVQGQLSIEFRMNGYLRYVINEHINRNTFIDNVADWKKAKMRRGGLGGVRLDQLNEDQLIGMVQGMAERGDMDVYKDAVQAIEGMYWPDKQVSDAPPIDTRKGVVGAGTSDQQEQLNYRYRYHRPGLFSAGFDIKILVGQDPSERHHPTAVKVIRDVNLVGESFTSNIDVPDGSRPIREVYNFFARDVVPVKSEFTQPPSKPARVG